MDPRTGLLVSENRPGRSATTLVGVADAIVLDLEDALDLPAPDGSPGAAPLDGRMIDRFAVLRARRTVPRAGA